MNFTFYGPLRIFRYRRHVNEFSVGSNWTGLLQYLTLRTTYAGDGNIWFREREGKVLESYKYTES